TGPFTKSSRQRVLSRRAPRLRPKTFAYRPKRGRSPLRLEICALAINSRSMVASSRPNSELEGTSATEAVLDIVFPFLGGQPNHCPVVEGKSMYARYQRQLAWLHGSI